MNAAKSTGVEVRAASFVGSKCFATAIVVFTLGRSLPALAQPCTPPDPQCFLSVHPTCPNGIMLDPDDFPGGTPDEFCLPTDPANPALGHPSCALAKPFDDPATDRFFCHTMTGIPSGIGSAILEIRMQAGNSGGSFNDAILLQWTGGSAYAWSRRIGQDTGITGLTGAPWTPGTTASFCLDLGALPNESGPTTNILPHINSTGQLDILVQDDTTIDYARLWLAQCPCETPPLGMVAWWRLDEQSGATAFDAAGNNDATYVNSPTQTPLGQVDGALECIAGHGLSTTTPFNFLAQSDFTIDAWVKIPSTHTGGEFWIVDRDFDFHFAAVVNSFSAIHLSYDCGIAFWPPNLMTPDTWAHVAVTVKRGQANGLRKFFNGAFVGSQNACAYTDNGNNIALKIGRGGGRGVLDEIEIFDRALGDGEILAIYQASAAGKCKCDPVDPDCPESQEAIDLEGLADDFAPAPVDGPTNPNAGTIPICAGAAPFDGTALNQAFCHTITGLPSNIAAATLEIRVRNLGAGSNNDAIALQWNGTTYQWSRFIGSGNPNPGLLSTPWNTFDQRNTFCLDLAALPLAGGGFLDLLSAINTTNSLDVYVQDDTAVDYIRLHYFTCPCAPLEDGSGCTDADCTCFGECINGGYCDDPNCCLDPNDCLCYAPNHQASIKRCGDCFGECVNGSYCDDPADPQSCWTGGGGPVCWTQNNPISIYLCGDCFGECINGSYCDHPNPACCIDPGNCLCYAQDHPISIKMCADQGEQCQPSCVTYNQLTGITTVTDCECGGAQQCHATVPPPGAVPPQCVDGCPPGEVCEQTDTLNPDGTIQTCCRCVKEACQPTLDGSACTNGGCECFGECINGSYCDDPNCCIEPGNCVCYAKNTQVSIELCGDCFGECINGSYCDSPVPGCALEGGPPVCWVNHHPYSIYLCGDCFGECINGSYCDNPNPDCCIDPGNCVCYVQNHPISVKMCGGGKVQDCQPTCVNYDPVADMTTVIDCDCAGVNECHATVPEQGGGRPTCVDDCPPGETCDQSNTVNPDGTIDVCCRCVRTPPCPPLCPPALGDDKCAAGSHAGQACSTDADCGGNPCAKKNRYLSMSPSGFATELTVLRVIAVSLPGTLSAFNGDVWYAGASSTRQEGPPGGTFTAAALQCGTAELRDWSTTGLLHLYGAIIVPGALYEISHCTGVDGACSPPLLVETAKHGDVVAPFGQGQPSFIDISALVDKFKGAPGAISKTRAQLQPNVVNPDAAVSFLDISADVDAFRGRPYSFPGAACP